MNLKEKNCCNRQAHNGGIIQFLKLVVLVLLQLIFILSKALFRLVYPATEKSVKGEIVLVTGAGHGIGKELALQYASLDATVVCLDINGETNHDTVAEITKRKKVAFGYTCDVANEIQVRNTISKILNEVGDISIVVNNAGILQTQSFLKLTSDDVRKTFGVNTLAHFWVLQMVLPTMIKNNHGHIVAVTSGLGLFGLQHLTSYCSSKFATIGLMKSLEDEVRKYPNNRIKFTTILPGIVDTGLCTNYCLRLPFFTEPVSPVKVAESIISAQRRDVEEVSVPNFHLPLFRFASLLPNQITHLIIDAYGLVFHL